MAHIPAGLRDDVRSVRRQIADDDVTNGVANVAGVAVANPAPQDLVGGDLLDAVDDVGAEEAAVGEDAEGVDLVGPHHVPRPALLQLRLAHVHVGPRQSRADEKGEEKEPHGATCN